MDGWMDLRKFYESRIDGNKIWAENKMAKSEETPEKLTFDEFSVKISTLTLSFPFKSTYSSNDITHALSQDTTPVMHISTYANKQTYTQQAACVP